MTSNVILLVQLCAKRFDPARLNPDALVIAPEIDEIMRLEGWDNKSSKWQLTNNSGEVHLAFTIADAYLVRRTALHIGGRPGATYKWETPEEFRAIQSVVTEIVNEYIEKEEHV